MKAKIWYDKEYNCLVKTTEVIEQARMSLDEIDLEELEFLIHRIRKEIKYDNFKI